MDSSYDQLKRFIDTVNGVRLWDRIFGWKKVRTQLVYAAAELESLIGQNDSLRKKISAMEGDKIAADKGMQMLTQRNDGLDRDVTRANVELGLLRKNESSLVLENANLKKDDEIRRKEHSTAVTSLQEIRESIRAERDRELKEASERAIEKVKTQRIAWSQHEEHVKQLLKGICQRHTIEYVDAVPFSGKPDNTMLICDEYIVFDAKSPGTDDLKNFPSYLKDQAEKAGKYTRQEKVKSDVFFVVPTNTLDSLSIFVYKHGDHDVYIVSEDALEPVILGLKKIEDYEFAEQLNPEDRENICRILGRFAHLSKRRIQVDSFFAKQFISLAYKCENDLPEEILDKVIEFERSEKLNPPVEKRDKAISTKELEKESDQVRREADGRGINIDEGRVSGGLDEVPLYKLT